MSLRENSGSFMDKLQLWAMLSNFLPKKIVRKKEEIKNNYPQKRLGGLFPSRVVGVNVLVVSDDSVFSGSVVLTMTFYLL